MVCPMRVVLVVVSAFIAGYLTWKTWESTSDILSADAAGSRRLRSEDPKKTGPFSLWEAIKSFFVTLFDMASGRYLYKAWLIEQDAEDDLTVKLTGETVQKEGYLPAASHVPKAAH